MCVGEDLKENIHKKALFLRLRCFCSLWLIWPFPGWLWAEPGNNVLSSLKFMKNQKNHNSGGCSVPADAMKGSWDRPSGSILSFFSGSNKQKIVRGSDASRHLQPTASLSADCRHFWTKHSSVLPERNWLKAFFYLFAFVPPVGMLQWLVGFLEMGVTALVNISILSVKMTNLMNGLDSLAKGLYRTTDDGTCSLSPAGSSCSSRNHPHRRCKE